MGGALRLGSGVESEAPRGLTRSVSAVRDSHGNPRRLPKPAPHGTRGAVRSMGKVLAHRTPSAVELRQRTALEHIEVDDPLLHCPSITASGPQRHAVVSLRDTNRPMAASSTSRLLSKSGLDRATRQRPTRSSVLRSWQARAAEERLRMSERVVDSLVRRANAVESFEPDFVFVRSVAGATGRAPRRSIVRRSAMRLRAVGTL